MFIKTLTLTIQTLEGHVELRFQAPNWGMVNITRRNLDKLAQGMKENICSTCKTGQLIQILP